MGPPGCDLQMDAHHVSLRGLNPMRLPPPLPLSRLGHLGIRHRWEFVSASLDGQVTGWVRCRWRPAKSSLTGVLGWLSPSASHPTSAVRLRWLTPLLAQQHRSPAFETPRENSLRCRRSEQRGFARRCYQGTRCTQLGGCRPPQTKSTSWGLGCFVPRCHRIPPLLLCEMAIITFCWTV
jgi:hypothetical protein